MDDEFRGGTSAGGVTEDVTGSELAEVCQQSYMRVMGCNTMTPFTCTWTRVDLKALEEYSRTVGTHLGACTISEPVTSNLRRYMQCYKWSSGGATSGKATTL